MKALLALAFVVVMGLAGINAHAEGQIEIEVEQDKRTIPLSDAQTTSLQVLLEDGVNFEETLFPHVPAFLEDRLQNFLIDRQRSFVTQGEIFEAVRKACANDDLTTKEKNAIAVNLIGRAC